MGKRIYEFTVIDRPIPMGRKRVNNTGDKPHHYTESKDVRSLYMIRKCFLDAYPRDESEASLITGPVFLAVRYFHKAPATMSRKKRMAAWMAPAVITKPDIPNLLAQVADALTGYAYVDDSRIVESCQWKFYAIDQDGNDTPPRFTVIVREL